jgi:hypothetical protein
VIRQLKYDVTLVQDDDMTWLIDLREHRDIHKTRWVVRLPFGSRTPCIIRSFTNLTVTPRTFIGPASSSAPPSPGCPSACPFYWPTLKPTRSTLAAPKKEHRAPAGCSTPG